MASTEIFEDLTPLLGQNLALPSTPTGLKKLVQVRNVPYISGSVNVFINGMLQNKDLFVELNASLGYVGIFEDVVQDVSNDQALTIAYLTDRQVYARPDVPIHISKLVLGDVVRVALKTGHQMEPVMVRGVPQLVTVQKRKRTNSFDRTLLLGYITSNQPDVGRLELQVSHSSTWERNNMVATFYYKDIKFIRKYLPSTRPINELRMLPGRVGVGGGSNAYRHPSAQVYRGCSTIPLKLINVFF